MANAKATMTLDATGATKGAKEFQNAADIIFNADKKAKTQLEKPAKTEAVTKKAKADLTGLATDLSKVTSVSGGLEMALSKIGGGLKVAGVAVVVNEMVGRFGEATAAVTALREEMALLSRPSGGFNNTGLVGLDQITSQISSIEAFLSKNRSGFMDYGSVAQSFWGGIGTSLNDTIMRGAPFSMDMAVNGQVDRANSAETALRREKGRLSKKYGAGVDRLGSRAAGDAEGVEIAEINARFDEQLGAAASNSQLQKQIERARKIELEAAKARRESEGRQRTSGERFATLSVRDARNALGASSEQEQRQANKLREDQAISSWSNLMQESLSRPKDKQLASEVYIAEQNAERVRAENAKWERDIARSKGDALKITIAGNEALSLEIKGQTNLAAITRQRAANELAIVQAQRIGNRELADQLKISGDLERSELARRRVMEGDRVLRASQVRSRERQAEVDAALSERVSRRFADSEGRIVATAGRSPRSRRIGGANFDKTNGAGRASDADWTLAKMEMQGIGNRPFDEQFKPRGLDAMREASGSNAIAEMGFRKNISDIGMTRAERADALNKQKEERISSGKADPSEALASIAQILAKWDT